MKKLFSILALLALTFCARADVITATLTVTNTPTNGYTYTINGNVVTWTNVVSTPANQVANTNTIGAVTTNLFTQLAGNPSIFTGASLRYNGTNGIILTGPTNLTVAISTNWATLTLATNTSGGQTIVLPITVYPPSQRTNLASLMAKALNDYSTNSFATNAAILIAFVPTNGTFNGIVLSGIVSNATAISGTVVSLTNGGWTGASLTNAQNFGNAFRSPGSGTGSEQFGLGATATANQAVAFGDGATASGAAGTAIGFDATASGAGAVAYGFGSQAIDAQSTAIGNGATANLGSTHGLALGAGPTVFEANDIAIGNNAAAQGPSATAIGDNAASAFDSSTALGKLATSTTTHQVRLGTSSESVSIPGPLQVDGGISNLTTLPNGVHTFNGKLVIPGVANSSLANSNNAAVSVSTNGYVYLSGPTGAFYIAGIAGGIDGRIVYLENSTGQTMVIGNQSGVDSTAANRILTGYSADRTFTNDPAIIGLRYDGNASRWKLFSAN